MFKLPILVVAVSWGLTACVSSHYSQPSNLRFQEKKQENTQTVNVKRDDKLCEGDTKEKQNCPIDFYIDSIQAGRFYINNSAQYHLKPENYNFKVKNCTEQECVSCDVDVSTNNLDERNFLLSVNDEGRPFISNGGVPLVCSSDKKISPPKESTVHIDLAADTLFKFNGSSLNDILPNGYQEVVDLSSKIKNEYVSVSQIKLVGHTDRLGSTNYNQQLGLNRANTVKNLFIQEGVTGVTITALSSGEQQPVTDGCFSVTAKEDLRACLQPDRRVTVEITGISK